MHQVYDSNSRAKPKSRPGSLSGGTTRHEGAHQRIEFVEALVQAALSGDGIGGDQSCQDTHVYLILDRPERPLAGRIGQSRTAARRETLGLHGNAQQKKREE
jgi:hypothetical protein